MGCPQLAPGWLLHRNGDPRVFNLRCHAILEIRLAPTPFLSRRFPALVIELFEAIKTLAAVAPHFARLRDIAPLFGSRQQPNLYFDYLLRRVHFVASFCPQERFGQRSSITLSDHIFAFTPKRWVVERSFAWAARFRRLARDYERLPETLAGLHFLAFAIVMFKRFVTLLLQSA